MRGTAQQAPLAWQHLYLNPLNQPSRKQCWLLDSLRAISPFGLHPSIDGAVLNLRLSPLFRCSSAPQEQLHPVPVDAAPLHLPHRLDWLLLVSPQSVGGLHFKEHLLAELATQYTITIPATASWLPHPPHPACN